MNRDGSAKLGWTYRLLIDAMIASIGLVAVIAIIGLVLEMGIDLYFRMLSCAALGALCLATLVAVGAVLRRGRYRIVMSFTIAATLVGTAVSMIAVWWWPVFDWRLELLLRNIAFTVFGTGVVLAHGGVLAILPVQTWLLRIVRILTIFSVAFTAMLFAMLFWLETAQTTVFYSVFDTILIVLLVFVPAGIVGTIVVPITVLSRANRRELPAESMASRIRLQLECPLCGHPQHVRMGNVRCAKCGGGLFVEVEEPRCECGYLLYRLQSPTCPECGRMIDPALCWSGDTPSPHPATVARGQPAAGADVNREG